MDKIIATPAIPFKLNYFDQRPEKFAVKRMSGDGAIFVSEDQTTQPIGLCKPEVQKHARKALIEYEFVVELPPAPKTDIFKDHHDTQRLNLERRICWNLMRFLAAHGWQVSSVYDGEETVKDKNPVDAMETIFSVDESRVRFRKAGWDSRHVVLLILGNGEDVIADHSVQDADDFAELMDQFPIEKVRDAVTVYAAPTPETLDMLVELCSYARISTLENDPIPQCVIDAEALLKLHGLP